MGGERGCEGWGPWSPRGAWPGDAGGMGGIEDLKEEERPLHRYLNSLHVVMTCVHILISLPSCIGRPGIVSHYCVTCEVFLPKRGFIECGA